MDNSLFPKSSYLQRPKSLAIQCSHRSSTDRCINKAIALVQKEDNFMEREPEALCGPCCLVLIERCRPGEHVSFERLD